MIEIAHKMAGNMSIRNATEIRIDRRVNGSGFAAFGARGWPGVSLRTALPADRPGLAEKLEGELADFIRQFIADNGLLPDG